MAQDQIPRLAEVRLNRDVFLFSFVSDEHGHHARHRSASRVAFRHRQPQPPCLKQEQAGSSESRKSRRFRDALIVGEVALTLTLSVASVLLARQMIAQSRQDLGFVPDNLLVMDTHAENTQPQPPFGASPASLATLRACLTPSPRFPA
jgi:putative ABC transport system permease protein